jgi:hypothetical protein
VGHDLLGPRPVGETGRGHVGGGVLLGMELKINACGPRGILEVYRFRLTCVGFGRSRDATECRIARAVFSTCWHRGALPLNFKLCHVVEIRRTLMIDIS